MLDFDVVTGPTPKPRDGSAPAAKAPAPERPAPRPPAGADGKTH